MSAQCVFFGRWVEKHTKVPVLHNIQEAVQCKQSPQTVCLGVGLWCPGTMLLRLPGYL